MQLIQGVLVTAAELVDIEYQVLAMEVLGGPKTTSTVIFLEQCASMLGIAPLNMILLGLILDGSMSIFVIVSA